MPKSNANLQKYTGRVVNSGGVRMFDQNCVQFSFIFLGTKLTVDVFISAASTGHSMMCVHWRPSLVIFVCVFVFAGLASCPAEVVLPSPMGLGSAVCRARVGELCTYLSWRVRAEFELL